MSANIMQVEGFTKDAKIFNINFCGSDCCREII
jgi:hypothetical protein